ncbi:MAG: hypothetical protein C5B53_02675 [Candidatus Melainabacteria bacterium]|nr:MAG: hypothetical protein C5B53_02675 [Candidatus Melainabacteria bacterium]
MISYLTGKTGEPDRRSFRPAVLAAQAVFLRTFLGSENAQNRPQIVAIDHAQMMLATHDVACTGEVSDLQILRLEGAIVCLLCRGLQIGLADLSGVHPGFAERDEQMRVVGAPDLASGLTAIQAFALEACQSGQPPINLRGRGTFASRARDAASLYWRASWYPHVPWVMPGEESAWVDLASIRGTNQPDDTCFFMLPLGRSIPQFDPRPEPDDEAAIWDSWWLYQLLRFPPETQIWRGERQWAPLREYIRDLGRKANKGS